MKKAGYVERQVRGLRIARSPWSATTRRPGPTPPRSFKSQLEELGFDVNFQKVTHDIMYTKFCSVPENAPEVCPNVGWLKDFNDGQSMLDPTFNGENVVPENNSNWPQLDVPEINEAIDEAKLIDDPEERDQAWADVDTMVRSRPRRSRTSGTTRRTSRRPTWPA